MVEITPKESWQSITRKCGRAKVEYVPHAEPSLIFNFQAGKNSPERKYYILDKLVVSVEE